MAGVQIKLDSRGMEALLKSDQMRPPLRAVAERVAATARSTAPVDSGEYRDSITVVSATTDRAVERVVATAPHGLLVEAKTSNLKRAMR